MSSLNIESNVAEVVNIIIGKLEDIDIKGMTALQASTAIADMRKRIHVEGKDSNGAQIGTYSAAYLKVRTGLYSDAKKAKKGVKSAGKFSKGKSKGGERPKYQRGSDPKIILSLTRQMESDMIIIPIENGAAIGYSNEFNFNKSQWNETKYKKNIFNLTEKEKERVFEVGQEFINDTVK